MKGRISNAERSDSSSPERLQDTTRNFARPAHDAGRLDRRRHKHRGAQQRALALPVALAGLRPKAMRRPKSSVPRQANVGFLRTEQPGCPGCRPSKHASAQHPIVMPGEICRPIGHSAAGAAPDHEGGGGSTSCMVRRGPDVPRRTSSWSPNVMATTTPTTPNAPDDRARKAWTPRG